MILDAALRVQADAWFSDDARGRTLGQATLARLTAAFPTLPAADGASMWFETALARLARLQGELEGHRLPAALPEPQWRYLIFARCLYDALEQAHGLWQLVAAREDETLQAVCPLTSPPLGDHAGKPRARRRRPRHGGQPLPELAGLGSILAGRGLPPEGRALIIEAASLGVDWCRSERFWALLANTTDSTAAVVTASTPHPPPAASLPAPPATDRHPALAPRAPAHPEQSTRSPCTPAPLAEALTTALGDVIQGLWHERQLNRRDGLGWVRGRYIHVVAKALAERLLAHPRLADHARVFQVRKRLYRALLAHKLIEARGLRPTATLIVTENGQQQRATVVTLPLALV